MVFPIIDNRSEWKIAIDNEDYFLVSSKKDRVGIGKKTIYEKLVEEGRIAEKVLELNLFERGGIIQTWFRWNGKDKTVIQSRILKNGQWVYGLVDACPFLRLLVFGAKLWGIEVGLEINKDNLEKIWYMRGGNAVIPTDKQLEEVKYYSEEF